MPAPDAMVDAYIECALWSSTDTRQDEDGNDIDTPLDEVEGYLSDGAIDRMRADCDAFYAKVPEGWEDAYTGNGSGPVAMLGHDFWLTRNGHGAGFWDGDWEEPFGTKLDELAKGFGTVDLYVGDDGQIYSM